MAENQEGVISSLYPPPPPYVKFFTNENLERFNKLQHEKQNTDKGDVTDEKDLYFNDNDKELKFLIPPLQPKSENYRSFEDMGIPQLYNDPEKESDKNDSIVKIQELRTLLKSLLLNFLEIIGVMSVTPEEFHTKVDQIRTILINIHHLLNEYRPHQSRESLILLLEKQIDTKKNEIQEIQRICDSVEGKIKKLVDSYVDGKPELKVEEDGNEEEGIDINQETEQENLGVTQAV
ncbi:hypothetical protein WICMUC_000259 [Wickerhamomyces mucosus]|uniref:Mediator of RNA polymerase II transcription subunit 7 n=1 Tax=Wickerhamomyces mucosus TaxID=1378264 RepID=A0A9P8PY87_9ASCO|nr:hypothetical protein WICMUC_000259 [Wickerhamomyces mucosus]